MNLLRASLLVPLVTACTTVYTSPNDHGAGSGSDPDASHTPKPGDHGPAKLAFVTSTLY